MWHRRSRALLQKGNPGSLLGKSGPGDPFRRRPGIRVARRCDFRTCTASSAAPWLFGLTAVR